MRTFFLCAFLTFSFNELFSTEKSMNTMSYGYGVQHYTNETLPSVYVNGSVFLEGTIVTGEVKVNGSMQANKATLNNIELNGELQISNSNIAGNVRMNGFLQARQSHFLGTLSIAAQRMSIKTCTITNLHVRSVEEYQGIQVIDARGGTKITSSIIVDSGKGEIWVTSPHDISASVVGAEICIK